MKKLFLLILLGVGWFQSSMAQNWNEWLRQKKTQKKYLIQQIAGLQVYINYARKGYRIVDDGLSFIGDVKQGKLNLHQAFFGNLKSVNPAIANYVRVADILLLQFAILDNYRQLNQQIQATQLFSTEQSSYVQTVFDRLMEDCADLLDELASLTAPNKLEMDDGERLQRIDQLYLEMMDKYRFSADFGSDIRQLNNAKNSNREDIEHLENIYDLTKEEK